MRAAATLAAAFLVSGMPAAAGPRVMALDQCADQYVLALSPRQDIVALSMRARNADAYLRAAAIGLPERRATAEAVFGAAPQVVVRYWGGDDRLAADLTRRGVRVLTIKDATDFAGIADNIRRVAVGLGAGPAGERLISQMNLKLSAAAGAGGGREIFYLTPGGDTAGPGDLVDAMIRAAGFANLEDRRGYGPISLERLLLHPPSLVAMGFFDSDLAATERWSVGREAVLKRLIARRQTVSLPSAILACPAWFAADGADLLAIWARTHPERR